MSRSKQDHKLIRRLEEENEKLKNYVRRSVRSYYRHYDRETLDRYIEIFVLEREEA